MSFSLHNRAYAVAAAAMVVALAGCSVTENTSTTSSANTSDKTSVTDGASASDGAAATADTSVTTSDAANTTAPSDADAATATAQGPPTALDSDDDAFALEVPPGWQDALDTAPDGTVLAAQSTIRAADSFTTLVITQGDAIADLDEVVAASVGTLEDEDAEVESIPDIEIDGEAAYGFTTQRSEGDASVTDQQLFVNFDGSLYTVTFSAPEVSDEKNPLADQEFEDILRSWEWSQQD